MGLRLNRNVTWLAIFAVALHVILLGLAPIGLAGSASADPFSVICHSATVADAADHSAPARDDLAPGHACEHCTLCHMAAAPAPADLALAGKLTPRRLIDVLRPLSPTPRRDIASDPKLARAPPRFA